MQVFEEARLENYFELDFTVTLPEFLVELHRVHDDLALYAKIYEAYPDGLIDVEELKRLELPETWNAKH